jgi:hypothetical protein
MTYNTFVAHEQTEPVMKLAAASNRQFLYPASPSDLLQDSSSPAPSNTSETDGTSSG